MTEQEKREKAIEEMESDICNGCKYYKGKDFCCICDVISYAKTLVGLHYRKEEEVRKETIKEFISFVKNVIDNYKPTVTETDSGIKTYHYLTDYELFDIINEKYSAEVE